MNPNINRNIKPGKGDIYTWRDCHTVWCYLDNHPSPDTQFRGFGNRAELFCKERMKSGLCQKGYAR
jgi:hypothetical protein